MPPKKGKKGAAVPMDVDSAGGGAGAGAAGAAAAAAPAVPNVDAGAESTHLLESTPDIFAAYKPNELGIPCMAHPTHTVESGLLATVPLPSLCGYNADGLPAAAVADGRLSDLQIESVLYAGQRHCLLVPSSATAASATASASAAAPEAGQPAQPLIRAGFFLGDGTGVGKGRQLTAMVLDNIARGRKKHLWISTSIDLANEAAKDFKDLGAPGVAVRDQNDLDKAYKGPLGLSKEFADPSTGLVVFCTYSGLIAKRSMGGGSSASVGGAGGSSAKVKRVDLIVQFLGGPDFEGLLLFDEAHRAKSYNVDKPESSSQMSQAVLRLQEALPKARVVYASATGLQSLESMAYAQRLLLWGNPSFPTFGDFAEKFMKKGDLSMLELLAVEMKASGAYVARSLSWVGSEFDVTKVHLSAEQKALYARLCKFFQDLKEELETAIKAGAVTAAAAGGKSTSSPFKVFWSLQQRFFRDVLNSCKVAGEGGIVSQVEEALADGHCVVIGLQSTGEAGLAKLLEENNVRPGQGALTLQELPSAPKQALKAFILQHFPTLMPWPFDPVPTVEEVEQIHRLKVEKGLASDLEEELRKRETLVAAHAEGPPPPQPDEGLESARDYLLGELEDLPVPPSPLDALIDALGGSDRVAEMTGRKGRIVRQGDAFVYELRDAPKGGGGAGASSGAAREEAIDSTNIREREAFMKGRKLIAVISDAASTGISLHASLQPSCTNRRRRVHITLELAFAADKTLQQLGRSHRSNSASAPIYKLLTTDAGGEHRFASGVAKKLLSLGALTRGDRRAATVVDFSAMNLEGREGGRALRSTVEWIKGPPEAEVAGFVDFVEELGQVIEGVDMSDGAAILKALYDALDSIDLLECANAQLTVPRFLNRLLMVPVPEQNLLFELFSKFHEQVIKDAKQAGTHDEGVMDLRATHITLKGDPVTVWRDATTGATSEALAVELDRGVPFADALAALQEAQEADDARNEASFWLSNREQYGRRNVLLAVPKISAPHLVFITRPNTGRSHFEMDLGEVMQAYTKCEPGDAQSYWDSCYNDTEDHCIHGPNCKVGRGCTQGARKQSLITITGLIVPIFEALEQAIRKNRAALTKAESQLRVVRVALDDGTKRVGIRFPASVLTDLQASIEEIACKHAALAQQPVLEPPTPVDPAIVKKYQAESKRKLTAFFQKVTPEQASAAAAAAALAPVQQPPGKGGGTGDDKGKDGKKKKKK